MPTIDGIELDIANEEFNYAVDFVQHTDRLVYLTGKAGTGKTTFLKYIKENTKKKSVILAYTGVAAINAGGQTINSFFQIKPSIYVPNDKRLRTHEDPYDEDKSTIYNHFTYNKEKLEIINHLELLIIDEVSMLRCDLLDVVDRLLRVFRKRENEMFGGVQVILIGDTFQLPPIATENEWDILQQFYENEFFFSSQVIKNNKPIYIELKKIYRQKEQDFIDLLNRVRINEITQNEIDLLNTRFKPVFVSQKNENHIMLATHNDIVERTNLTKLAELSSELKSFEATVIGDFPESIMPTDYTLQLKENAQIMFVKNDAGEHKRYFNGKIAKIIKIDEDGIIAELSEGNKIIVEKETWENRRYTWNDKKKKIEEEVIGTFTQYPIRLAWAITVHKSQGLTFDKVIADLDSAFAPGQVYVALSRCTTFNGLILRTKLHKEAIKTAPEVLEFAKNEMPNTLIVNELNSSKEEYYKKLEEASDNLNAENSTDEVDSGNENITDNNKIQNIIKAGNKIAGGITGTITWDIYDNTLIIGGNGAMRERDYSTDDWDNYEFMNDKEYYQYYMPWYFYRDVITAVIIEKGVTKIRSDAFEKCDKLVSIDVNNDNSAYSSKDGVLFDKLNTTLLQYPKCKTNKNYHIPNSVTIIKRNAFNGCSNLRSVTIPDSVTNIEYGAFWGCGNLTSITIPDNVTSLGGNAFYNCTNLQIVNYNAINCEMGFVEYSSDDYDDDDKEEDDIHYWINDTRSVFVFSNCPSFTTLNIGNNVTMIPDAAFYGCDKLTSVIISNSVTNIGDYAFYGCNSLTFVSIGNGVTKIAFSDCPNLTSIDVDNNNPAYSSEDGVLFDKSKTTLIQYPAGKTNTNYIIPNSVITFESFAFSDCRNLTSVTIPDGVTKIESYAFSGCTGLTSIIIPNSVITIESFAFKDCSNLRSVTIPDSVTKIESYAFSGCTCLTSITIPKSVTSIEGSAFSGCTGLTFVSIPESVTSIKSWAFKDCSNLMSITIPNSVTKIDSFAFDECTSLISFDVNNNNSAYCSENGVLFNKLKTTLLQYPKGKTGANYNIPNGVVSIGSYAFRDCINLTSVTIPDSVTNIEGGAFGGCENLTSIIIPDSVTNIGSGAFSGCENLTSVTVPNNVTDIGSDAFQNCKKITSINIPDSISSIRNSVFRGCKNLTYVTIPDSVTNIEGGAFGGCENLTSIIIPDSVTSIGSGAFSGCENLTSIIIPDSVTSIGSGAFSGCENLISVTIGNGVTSIEDYAFKGCNLKHIKIQCTVPPAVGNNALINPKTCVLDIPADSKTEYAKAKGWKEFNIADIKKTGSLIWDIYGNTLIIRGEGYMPNYNSYPQCTMPWAMHREAITAVFIEEGVTSIGKCAFYNCRNLISVTIPNSVKRIESSAFSGCKSLTVLMIPNKLTMIEFGAFSESGIKKSNTGELTWTIRNDNTLVISGNGAIHDYIFREVDSMGKIIGYVHFYRPWDSYKDTITSIIIENGVTHIGGSAFYDCKKITSVTIPDTVKGIRDYAFKNCSSLTSVTIPNSVTSIENGAFYNCTSLNSITIPDSVVASIDSAFYGCTSLSSINVGSNDTIYHSENGILFDKSKTKLIKYPAGKTDTNYIIPNGVISIEKSAFANCPNLTTVTIPNSVTNIGDYAFVYCQNLTSITIPDGVKTIGNGAFRKCVNLIFINIPHRVTRIGTSTFEECSRLTFINIPDSVINIEYNAFWGCRSLIFINVANSTAYSSENGILFDKLKTKLIQYPAGKTDKNYSIPNSVTSIGSHAFEDCHNLTSVIISDSVTSIEWAAFKGCCNLTSIIIPNGITSIGTTVFEGCSNLTSVTIPDSVTSIEWTSFKECTNLKNINTLCIIPPSIIDSYGFTAFKEADKNICVLHVPTNSRNRYANAEGWKEFENIQEMPDNDKDDFPYLGAEEEDLPF